MMDEDSREGRYLYCIAEGSEEVRLGKIGIEGSEVYTIPYRRLCAVVHGCPAKPYKSEDQEVVKSWIVTHQSVVDAAWKKFGTVLPSGFDTIIKDGGGKSPEANLREWLKEDYEDLRRKVEKVKGKAEYGVEVFWIPGVIAAKIAEENAEIKKIEEEIKCKPRGAAYLYQQKLEVALRAEMERKADEHFRDFYDRIKRHVNYIRIEKAKKGDKEKQMLMNLSCLMPKDKSHGLGDDLGKINEMEGFSVRFTGPWPPYSFA